MGKLKTTRAVAAELGVSQRSIERYRTGERKTPPKAIADRIDAAVRARWQPKVRDRRRKEAATRTGITAETRARFGYTAPIGTTDDGRRTSHTVGEQLRTWCEGRRSAFSDGPPVAADCGHLIAAGEVSHLVVRRVDVSAAQGSVSAVP
ncbi:hypothetical protein PV721_36480 [Streptomyces sp. MB09-01]|uniref:telomere-protecting terminal protein Tpg n=1 Tax=Streptomyces sp. MB09-01 TaxID=3028666 RepID=UPI0029AEB781|nr:hypothetical protein [Streptomyces sp. MB09-01]MDX3539727.1 hypothetical protein [Streptomyces sp. MB09-01]